MFLLYFDGWILNLRLDMNIFKWTNFIHISFIICFIPNLNQNIGLKIMYLLEPL
jgi:hypothetical protein